ncbi:MAG: ABC transporter permease [Verrucomicrobia bacterium]|nr:ABC transporter permease [Verrucomicrobiota bacterium]
MSIDSTVSPLPVTIYTPESPLRHPGKLIREMVRDLLASRELAWRLFVRDTSAMYRQSVLGYVWAFLPPVATTLTFAFLNSQSIINVGATPIPYPAFVMIGTLLWGTFMDALNSPMRAVTSARSMLSKINFPREALVLGGMADVLFNFLIRMVLLVPLFMLYKLPITASLLLMPLGIIALLLLGLMFGLLLTPLGILYTDVGRGVGLIAGFWMLLTPVVYPPPHSGLGALLAKLNPVSPVLQTAREWLTAQPVTHLTGFLLVTGVSVLALLAGWVIYRLTMPILVERMGG